MQSTQEINAQLYGDKLAEKEAARLKAIADGLGKIKSLDTDKIAQELTKADYVKHAHEDLRRLMRRSNSVEGE